jgi:hypothetical protein
MTTYATDWVEEVRETLGGGITEQVNRLAADYQPGDTSIQLQYQLVGITAGVPISVGLNTFQVWSTTPSANEVEITPGWAGSGDTAVLAGEIVRVKPNFYTHRILKAVNDTLTELSSPTHGLYAVGVQDLEYNQQVSVYDLTQAEGISGVLRVQVGFADDTLERWADLGMKRFQHRKLEATAEFPSGHQLRIFDSYDSTWPSLPEGDTLRVIYRRDFEPLTSLADDVTNTLLPETAYDLPVLGAAARLATPQEFRRNLLNAQPDARRALEVTAGASAGGARMLRQLFESRVAQEAGRLMADYSPKNA